MQYRVYFAAQNSVASIVIESDREPDWETGSWVHVGGSRFRREHLLAIVPEESFKGGGVSAAVR